MEKTRTGLTKTKALMAGAAVISLGAGLVTDAQAASGTGAMSAEILTPIVVAGTQVLHFGSATVTAATGTIVIDTAGARSVTGAVTAVVGGGAEQAGVISVTAATGLAIDLAMAATTYPVTETAGGVATMQVNTFNLRTNAGGTAETVTLAASPSTYPIGGTLNVGASQLAGTYQGAYTINANYQ